MSTKELSEYVTIISNDGFEFVVKRDAANVAGTIRKMLDPTSNFAEASSGRCTTGQFNGVVIEKLCEYLYYNLKHKDAKNVPDMEIPPSLCLELLVAADYFDGEVFPSDLFEGSTVYLIERERTGGGSAWPGVDVM
ncbi:MAG: hypothetical protein Q9219_001781 [cf. Caloplaca sp. 3 TL-2023]